MWQECRLRAENVQKEMSEECRNCARGFFGEEYVRQGIPGNIKIFIQEYIFPYGLFP